MNDHIKRADFTEIAVVQCGKCVLAEVVLCGRHAKIPAIPAIPALTAAPFGQVFAGIAVVLGQYYIRTST